MRLSDKFLQKQERGQEKGRGRAQVLARLQEEDIRAKARPEADQNRFEGQMPGQKNSLKRIQQQKVC